MLFYKGWVGRSSVSVSRSFHLNTVTRFYNHYKKLEIVHTYPESEENIGFYHIFCAFADFYTAVIH